MKDKVRYSYIKVSQIDRRSFEVSLIREDGDIEAYDTYHSSVKAENRAVKLAKQLNCDWGQDY